MDAEKLYQERTGLSDSDLHPRDKAVIKFANDFHQAKSKEEAQERYEKTVDLLMTDDGFEKHCNGLTVNSVIKIIAKLASGLKQ